MDPRYWFLVLLCVFLFPPVTGTVDDWTTIRADPRVEFSIPSDWIWEDTRMNYDWMSAYLVTTKAVPGLYALVMVIDNPVMQVPDEVMLDDLSSSLMEDYPEYHQIGETVYGADTNLPIYSAGLWENDRSEEKMYLILAGSKRTIVYLLLCYPSEDHRELYADTMKKLAESLKIL
jgi:hypothetical protein